MVTEKDAWVGGFIVIGAVLVIVGLYIQGWMLSGAQNWVSNDLYVAGAILVIIGFIIAMFWKD